MKHTHAKHITLSLLATILVALLSSCRDDTFSDFGQALREGEETDVTLTFDFMPNAEATLTRNGTKGDSMSGLDDLCVLIFDKDGKYVEIREIDLDLFKPFDKDRTSADTSNGELDATEGETRTKRVTATLPGIKAGTYYFFAAANLGGKNDKSSTLSYLESQNITDIRDFQNLRMQWDRNVVKNNNEMSGFFTTVSSPDKSGDTVDSDDYIYDDLKERTVTVNRSNMALHCWLRRLASKVTVDFDASGLLPTTYVYVKEVRLRDIPYDCALMAINTVDATKIETRDAENSLLSEKEDSSDCQKIDFTNGNANWQNWPCLTSGNSTFKKIAEKEPEFAYLKEFDHKNSAPSLFYYENMQGDTDSKLQDPDLNGTIDEKEREESFKDQKPAGTFVEVEAYYKSLYNGNEGEGKIIYRFMLGKDVTKSCDAERNYHLKLTMKFRGRANEVDWHIEYDNDYPPFSAPNPYYISYGYNQMLELPLVFRQEVDGDVELEIVRNDWRPYELWSENLAKENNQYYTGSLKEKLYGKNITYKVESTITDEADKHKVTQTEYPPTCVGFLSLRMPRYDAIGRHFVRMETNNGNTGADGYLMKYWEGEGDVSAIYDQQHGYAQNEKVGHPLYKRSYSNDPDNNLGDGAHDGSYRVVKDAHIENKTTYYIPLYTRERNLVKVSGFTGMNPYEGYQRRATVRATFKLKGKDGISKEYTEDIQIIQVARVVNPTAIWRDWNVAREFKVDIMLKDGQGSPGFHVLQSRGGWYAEVEKGDDWLMLNGTHQRVYGATGSDISFTVKPKGILASKNSAPRFAIVHVRYHNYTCSHRIFVRQGYAPERVTVGGVKWHVANMVSENKEATSPCDEGSMFKYGSWKYPIDASENGWYEIPWAPWNNFKDYFFDSDDREFQIAGQNIKKKFSEIDRKIPTTTTTFPSTTLGRVASPSDFANLRDAPAISFAYGVLYADEASRCQINNEDVYGYLQSDATTHSNGMRGLIAYNELTGAQVFFPIGRAGQGRRCCAGNKDYYYTKDELPDALGWKPYPYTGIGVLRYAAGRVTYFDEAGASATPMFWDKFYKEGGTYWLNNKSQITVNGEKKDANAIDINYYTFDFNSLSSEVYYGTDTDAMFVRLVSD